ncbi:hypothetical protein Bca52824_002343 [Brassica carinata]|uniref:Uncharacterized protein n=1 Tax=Brassica carinata TaxID=52824 RepID=A0A8X8BE77_BRACI|nr:hypothetical protein Bca52824_002343 [Brassica carinata]
MQGTVNVHRFNTLGHLFKAGSMCADVTRSNLSFKLSDSPLSILFSDLTAFVQITTQVNTKLVVLIPTPPSVSLDTMLSLLLLLKSEAVFVDFDREITKLTNIGAAEAGHIRTFTISHIFNERNCPPIPDFVVDVGNGAPLNDMSGASSLTTKVSAVPTVNENEPAGETTAGGASATDLLIPTSSKATKKASLA